MIRFSLISNAVSGHPYVTSFGDFVYGPCHIKCFQSDNLSLVHVRIKFDTFFIRLLMQHFRYTGFISFIMTRKLYSLSYAFRRITDMSCTNLKLRLDNKPNLLLISRIKWKIPQRRRKEYVNYIQYFRSSFSWLISGIVPVYEEQWTYGLTIWLSHLHTSVNVVESFIINEKDMPLLQSHVVSYTMSFLLYLTHYLSKFHIWIVGYARVSSRH